MVARSKSNQIEITRIYDAPVAAVWDAWTDIEQVQQWWGPRGFTLTSHSKELKPGGIWHYTMHGPDGVDYPNKTLYHEVEEHAKLVYDHGGYDDRPPMFRVTVLFNEITSADGKPQTQMNMTMTLPTVEAAEQARKFIKQAGGNATWDRLAEYLAKTSAGKEQFVIHRSFDAPRKVVFQMWNDPEHLSRWMPPTGSTMQILRGTIAAGQSTFFCMTTGGGDRLHGRIEYETIRPPELLVYRQQFCDENERVSRHPMVPVWPETMHTTVRFAEEGPDQTRVSVTWQPLGAVTTEELAAFVALRSSMTQGWTGSFDKLEEMLAG